MLADELREFEGKCVNYRARERHYRGIVHDGQLWRVGAIGRGRYPFRPQADDINSRKLILNMPRQPLNDVDGQSVQVDAPFMRTQLFLVCLSCLRQGTSMQHLVMLEVRAEGVCA